ncbi:MAG: tRNA uridine-5-carboxymethylaminomethyl(34) synthesis GTPase MnmE [Elusimicrobia bacterium]|nr:tRNA uridine-5-carboxymethylaminomethyl(34) synthesis GTPase MnmE [Elusimicrobiota bacterium]
MTRTADTIAAIATPAGVGALGVLRLSGPRARETAGRFLSFGPSGLEPRRAVVGRAFSGKEALDRVVAVFYPGPGTATGEDLVEVTAHGSPFILRRLLEEAIAAGARSALPGEFTQRAFLNGRLDLSQAEAVCDLIAARTGRAHRAALEAVEGALSREVRAAAAPIADLLVRVEAGLDHPEEDVPIVGPEEASAELERARVRVLALAGTFRSGRLLTEGARIAIVGRPNAGKSSLLNALLGAERAIVCPSPGTTRDTIEEPCDLGGIPAVLIDTAGLTADPTDEAEAMGIERTLRALERCDLALLVEDGSAAPGAEDSEVARIVTERSAAGTVIAVRSKSDLAPASGRAGGLAVSAATGAGISELAAAAAAALAGPGGEEHAVTVTSARHHAALRACAAELALALRAAKERPESFEELAAGALRSSLKELGTITGEDAGQDVLAAVFSRFCVGK